MVRTNIMVWLVAAAVLVAAVVVVVITGHRQSGTPPTNGAEPPSAPSPLNAAIVGLGLFRNDQRLLVPSAGPSAPVRRSPGGSTAFVSGAGSTAGGVTGPIFVRPAVVPQVSCTPSLLGSIVGLLTSLLGGGGACI